MAASWPRRTPLLEAVAPRAWGRGRNGVTIVLLALLATVFVCGLQLAGSLHATGFEWLPTFRGGRVAAGRVTPVFAPPDPRSALFLAGQTSANGLWRRFDALNTGERTSDRPVIVFRGDNQGLGNNLLTMLSALVFSVVLDRQFAVDWRGGGELTNLSDALSLRALGGPHRLAALDARADAHVVAAAEPGGECALVLGCCLGSRDAPFALNAAGCWHALRCSALADDALLSHCSRLSLSGNVYFIRVVQKNAAMRAAFGALFNGPVDQLLAQRVAKRALEPSLAAREAIAKLAPGWPYERVLGVQLRQRHTQGMAVSENIRCVLSLMNHFSLDRVFLATDNSSVREEFRTALGDARLVPSFDYALTDAEDRDQRARSVLFAWYEAVMIAQLEHKALTLPYSTFAHLIYVLSPPTARVFALVGCSEHAPWLDVFDYGPKPECDAPITGNLSSCEWQPAQ